MLVKLTYFKIKKRFFLFFCVVFLFFFLPSAEAQEEPAIVLGSCQGYEFESKKEGRRITEGLLSRVIRGQAGVYSCADFTKSCEIIKNLNFNVALQFLRYSNSPRTGRIEIETFGQNKIKGWMNRGDLLCAKGPLKDENHIGNRILVNTQNFKDGITFYFQSDSESINPGQVCGGHTCGMISPTKSWMFYFIVAEDFENQRFLLKKAPDMKQPVIGWVDQETVTLWRGSQRPGSCLDFEFDNFVGKERIANDIISRVLVDWAKVYSCSKGDCLDRPAPKKNILYFNDRLRLLKFSSSPREGRILVRELGTGEPLGWMERGDLLCATGPLKNKNNVDRKLFINPKPAKIDEIQSIIAYHSPSEEECSSDFCPQLSRFQLYYIVAEDKAKGRYLIKSNPRSRGQLVGWINREEGLPWNNALGIRPKSQVGFMYPSVYKVDSKTKHIGASSGQPNHRIWEFLAKNEKKTYTHQEILDLLDPYLGENPSFLRDYILQNTRQPDLESEVPHIGEKEGHKNINFTKTREQIRVKNEGDWYTRKKRIAILDTLVFEGQKFYHVIAPGVQSGFEENEEGYEKLNLLSQIDVFFLLDGTESMKPFIKRIPEVAETIANSFLKEDKERSVRLGFRVFRDFFSGQKNCKKRNLDTVIGEGLRLIGSCRPGKEQMQSNLEEFQKLLNGVRSTGDPGCDLYEGELFQGIQQALKDMQSCSGNVKLLFVLGGHGDNSLQASEELLQKLVPEEKPVIITFLKPPNITKNPNHKKEGSSFRIYKPDDYIADYNKLDSQAENILNGMIDLTLKPFCEKAPTRCKKEKNYLKSTLRSQILCIGEPKLCDSNNETLSESEFHESFQKGLQTLPKKILKVVDAYSSTEAIAFALTRLAGGMSLEEVIEQMEREVEEKARYILTKQTLNLLGDENFSYQILNHLDSSALKNKIFHTKENFIQALKNNIDGLREKQIETIVSYSKEKENLPVFLRTLFQSACKEFETQCKNRIDHRIFQAYIPIPFFGLTENSWHQIITKENLDQKILRKLYLLFLRKKNFRNQDEFQWKLEKILDKQEHKLLIKRLISSLDDDWQEELWISSEDLEKFAEFIKYLLGDYEDIEDQKSDFTRLLVEAFEALIGKPVFLKGQILANFFEKRSTLPLRSQSPFMVYTPEEIAKMEHCEFKELENWINESYSLIAQVKESPRFEVNLEEKPPAYDASSCPPIKPDHLIPVLAFDRGGKRFRNPKASYRHDLGDKVIYWLPKEFLP